MSNGEQAFRRPRIVDFSTHLSGPTASQLLTQMGADVIKVENARIGDGNRGMGPYIDGNGLLHVALNGGTRSLAIDRHSPNWDRVIAACARWADAVLVGTRPADARRRGLDFATMVRANPKLVYCSISGFGDAGPWRDFTAHGQTIDAFAGLVKLEKDGGGPRTLQGWRSTATTLGGVFAALGVYAALYNRDHGVDHAQYVSISLWGVGMWWSWRDSTMLANTGERWTEYTELGARYNLYATADDRVVLVAPSERKFWESFCDTLQLPEEFRAHGDWTASGMDHGEGPEYEEERKAIAERIAARPLAEWVKVFGGLQIPFAPLLTIEEALASEHALANGVMRTAMAGTTEVKVPATPVRMAPNDEPPSQQMPSVGSLPDLGANTDEVLAELGLGELSAADLRATPEASPA
ncbi:MAG TPA: CaiB/BaiF CoA-transferase family protein [Candidatus Dormibacteraeota bacterium]|jgi:crotonobetainyl-CoA:carnitine CoA-transferase CaiB-like acyl-CoA transferase|nr:CaiB/BaiF CoA-transferase family protein [Candidatus Dormibacteraeota bacterium]